MRRNLKTSYDVVSVVVISPPYRGDYATTPGTSPLLIQRRRALRRPPSPSRTRLRVWSFTVSGCVESQRRYRGEPHAACAARKNDAEKPTHDRQADRGRAGMSVSSGAFDVRLSEQRKRIIAAIREAGRLLQGPRLSRRQRRASGRVCGVEFVSGTSG
jgi:hypothetical protein